MPGAGAEKPIFVADTRRRWTLEEKLAIVGETETSPVNRVARKYGMAPGLLFRWRKMLGNGTKPLRRGRPPATGFIPIALPAPQIRRQESADAARDDLMEIVVSGNRRIIIGRDFDAAALRRVIEILELR
jgi:transposase